MSRVRANHTEHRDPADFDLPPGEWLCKFCACERLGIKRSVLKGAVDSYGIENMLAKPLVAGIVSGPGCAFFNKAHVLQAVLERGGESRSIPYWRARRGAVQRVFSGDGGDR